MPCYAEPEPKYIHVDEHLKQKVDKLTDMLCRVLTANFSSDFPVWVDTDIMNWWNKHKEWDKERLKK